MRLAALVVDLAAQAERALEGLPRIVPGAEVLVGAAEVVPGHGLLAQQTGRQLRVERVLKVLAGLGEVAHPVVDDRNAVERGRRLLRQIELLVKGLCTPQVHQAGGVVTLHATQVATLEQRTGEHLLVTRRVGHADGLLVQAHRLVVVAGVFADLALAAEQPGAQPDAAQLRQQRLGRRCLALGSDTVALRQVAAEQGPRADLEVGVGLSGEQGQRLLRQSLALVGAHALRPGAAVDERLGRVTGPKDACEAACPHAAWAISRATSQGRR